MGERAESPGFAAWHRKWLAALCLLVVSHFMLALVLSERPLADYISGNWIADVMPIMLAALGVWFPLLLIRLIRQRVKSPLRALGHMAVTNPWRIAEAGLLVGLFILTNRAYRAFKVAIPQWHDFSLDPLFARLDHALFGADPWTYTHALIGAQGTWLVDRLYVVWFPVIVLTYGWIVLSSDTRFRMRAAATYLAIWIVLGNLLALALASAGPVYFEAFTGSDRFAPLVQRLDAIGDLNATVLQSYLLDSFGQESVGAGISAMPSVHVAMIMLLVLMTRARFGWRWPTWLALAYLAAIQFGSVHLAWHYAIDGIASMALVAAIWWGLGRALPATSPTPPASSPHR